MTSPSQEELEDRLERFSRLLRLGHTAEALEAFQVLWESGQEVEVVLRLWQQRIRAVSKLSPAVAACSSWLVDAIGNGNVMRGMTRRFTFHALPLLLVAMRDTNEAVRQDAVRMLGHLGVASEEVLSRLVKAMRDPLRNVRCQAIDSATYFGGH